MDLKRAVVQIHNCSLLMATETGSTWRRGQKIGAPAPNSLLSPGPLGSCCSWRGWCLCGQQPGALGVSHHTTAIKAVRGSLYLVAAVLTPWLLAELTLPLQLPPRAQPLLVTPLHMSNEEARDRSKIHLGT